jgi:hypothetical protein
MQWKCIIRTAYGERVCVAINSGQFALAVYSIRERRRAANFSLRTHTTQLWKIDSRAFWLCVRVYQKASFELAKKKNTHPSLCLTEKRRFGKINIEQDTIPFYVCMPLLFLLSAKECWGCYYGNTSAISPLLLPIYISPRVPRFSHSRFIHQTSQQKSTHT